MNTCIQNGAVQALQRGLDPLRELNDTGEFIHVELPDVDKPFEPCLRNDLPFCRLPLVQTADAQDEARGVEACEVYGDGQAQPRIAPCDQECAATKIGMRGRELRKKLVLEQIENQIVGSCECLSHGEDQGRKRYTIRSDQL